MDTTEARIKERAVTHHRLTRSCELPDLGRNGLLPERLGGCPVCYEDEYHAVLCARCASRLLEHDPDRSAYAPERHPVSYALVESGSVRCEQCLIELRSDERVRYSVLTRSRGDEVYLDHMVEVDLTSGETLSAHGGTRQDALATLVGRLLDRIRDDMV